MQGFTAALQELKASCDTYETALKKTSAVNSELKITVDRMERALDTLKRIFVTSQKCGICFSRKPSHALECGHLLCESCGTKSLRAERCPFCRKRVEEMMRIYPS